ncbi:Enterobactin exporter EntS [Lacunisphaera limnophila]|uniref:Enterobactin exporter EntS n=1 Tax=Lacunisphaera limnophila TaxID=1838286 RepID=A0A1D8AXS5_9BACT|nr:MFS transporter [Lacunisphaera limnophila]AOS45696.1 Enterobactin exporter EntS [Lacunisphaera limnophila]
MTEPAHDPYAALRHAGYRRFLTGNFLANLGRQALGVAAAWQIYQWTNSATALGLVGLMNVVPLIAFVLPAGALADRYDRRLILTRGAAASALLSLALAAVSIWHDQIPALPVLETANGLLRQIALVFERHVDPASLRFDDPALPLLYLIILMQAVVRVLAGPSRASLVPLLIPTKALSNAINWNASAFELSTVIGPALGGLVVALWGYSVVYLFDVLASFSLVVLLIGVRPAVQPRSTAAAAQGALAGVGFMWRNPNILAAMSLDLFAVILGGVTALLPIYADKILHVGPAGLGWLRAAPAAGAIAMAMFTAHRPSARRPGLLMLWSVAGFGASLSLFSLSTVFWLSLVALFFSGCFDNYSVVVRHSLVQLMTPDALRGRVTAVNQLFVGSSNEISALRAGLTAALFGPVVAAGIGGLGTIAVTALIAWLAPTLKNVPPLHQIQTIPDEDERPL